jgi:BirA family transcriptional regulator, biotin operon repressor / biotin---[acetyl-CoA-carboxylase] ligase
MSPEPLPPEIADALRDAESRMAPFGRVVHYFHETGSTNDIAVDQAERGAPEGTTVVASAQTAGRGRLGREWFSPPDAGLYVSLICRNSAAAPLLTFAGGIGVADGVRAATGLPVEIKWPNDIMAPSGSAAVNRRKLAGILAEGSSTGDGVQYVVLGFGINLRPAAYPPEIAERATSLETELGRTVDPGPLLAAILVAFARRYAELAAGKENEVRDRWRALAPSAYGSRVEWDTERGRCQGITAGIAHDGALLIRTENGIERVISGTVVYR